MNESEIDECVMDELENDGYQIKYKQVFGVMDEWDNNVCGIKDEQDHG